MLATQSKIPVEPNRSNPNFRPQSLFTWLGKFACVTAIWVAASLSAGRAAAEPAATKQGLEFFEKKIRPVLVAKCYSCHSAEAKKLQGELFLDTKAGMLAGGESGEPAVVPGKPGESTLISALRHEDTVMPPEGGKLAKSVVADFVKWVEIGAPDPREGDRPGVVKKKISIEEGRKFWAFQPITNPPVPSTRDKRWPRDDVDRFLLAKLEAEGITPVADVDRLTLIRRLTYDLTGLPPTQSEVTAFLADKSPDALEKVVDRLLESPRFGERWGRHWLDLARYAESNGNVRNFTMPHAWRYRDWVIDAFNRDTPYDEFVTQQLAGDLLAGKTADERNRHKTATGFLVLCSKPQNSRQFKMDMIAEAIESSTRTFMGLTVACARCHDHKFDPIPTRDYYALAGVFSSSSLLYGGTGANGSAPKAGLHALESSDASANAAEEQRQREVAEIRARQLEIKNLLAEAKKLNQKPKPNRKRVKPLVPPRPGDLQGGELKTDPPTKIDPAALKRESKQLNGRLGKLQANKGRALAMGVAEAPRPQDCKIHLQGERPSGDTVPRGFVQVAILGETPAIPTAASGRLEFARWLTRGDHPLTARVMVNRVWHHLFGAGIVRTVDNFGINGERPSHPELLDHLATRFMREGWPVKKLIRTLVLSRAYGLSSEHNDKAYTADPENRWLWRASRRRLDAESLRDSILAASGQLQLDPPAGSFVAKIGDRIIRDNFTVAEFKVPDTHRSVYLPIIRNGLPDALSVFDYADPSLVVGRRDVTTVPAQELFLVNSPMVVAQARCFATDLLLDEEHSDAERISAAYWRALSRPATKAEITRAEKYVLQMTAELENSQTSAGSPNSVPARVRAWSSFCQALFISAEFRHIR